MKYHNYDYSAGMPTGWNFKPEEIEALDPEKRWDFVEVKAPAHIDIGRMMMWQEYFRAGGHAYVTKRYRGISDGRIREECDLYVMWTRRKGFETEVTRRKAIANKH